MRCIVVLLCLGGSILVAACSRDRERTRATETPTPTLFAATPTAAAIARPPQTPQTSDPPAIRGRAEAFLGRIAPTDADLPPGLDEQPPSFRDGSMLSPPSPGVVLSYWATFAQSGSQSDPTRVRDLNYVGYAFVDAAATQQSFDTLAASLQTTVETAGTAPAVRLEGSERLDAGDQAVAWRAIGSQGLAWGVAVRRGSAAFTVLVSGTGSAAEAFVRDLTRRLDQRLAAALAAGAWP